VGTFALGGAGGAQLLSSLREGTKAYFSKWGLLPRYGVGTWNHPTTLTAAAIGFAGGLVVGWQNPGLTIELGIAVATASTFLTDISIRGVIERRDVLFPNLDPRGFAWAILHFINRHVLGGTFIAIGFGLGLTAGSTVGASAREIYEGLK
jgi:hypothetical protein